MQIEHFSRFFSGDFAIDLGTANTSVYARGNGIVLHEPSVVAVGRNGDGSRTVLAVGNSAKMMLGRSPDKISVVCPVRDGVITDFEIVKLMLQKFLKTVRGNRRFLRPRVVMSIPTATTQVERRAFRESILAAGAREVYLVEEPMAAAIGADLPIAEPTGSMIVDVGAGTTETAVICLGGIAVSRSERIGGDKMNEAILHHIKRKYHFLIGINTAESLKINMGCANKDKNIQNIDISGKNLITGIPSVMKICSSDIREAIAEELTAVVDILRNTLEHTPPELASDLLERGIKLTGGGALLTGLDVVLKEATGLSVVTAPKPLSSVILGCARVLENLQTLRAVTS